MADVKRINRMVEILGLIDSGKAITPKGLAKHFGVAERTIYRDMACFPSEYPLYFDEEHGSYRFTAGYSLKKIDLSPDEIRAVLASKAVVSKLGHGVSKAYQGLMNKIKAGSSQTTGQRIKDNEGHYWFDIDPADNFADIQDRYEAIQRALDENVGLEITYQAMHGQKITERRIDPYGLFFSSGIWYVLAYCHKYCDVRQFALDCIKNLEITDRRYAIPKDFSMDTYFQSGWHIYKQGEPVEIKLRFSKDVARWITRKRWHPTEKVETKKDGSIIYRVTVQGTREIQRWIYHWGPNCEVLSPLPFRKEVQAELRAMLAVYSKNKSTLT